MSDQHGFSDEQWRQLKLALSDALAYISQADDGFVGRLKESSAASKYLSRQRERDGSPFIHDLAAGLNPELDKDLYGDEDAIAAMVTSELAAAYALVRAKLPGEAARFRALVLDAARVVAEANKGVSPQEAHVLEVLAKAFD